MRLARRVFGGYDPKFGRAARSPNGRPDGLRRLAIMLSVGARIVAAFRLLFTGKLPPDILSALSEGQPAAAAPAPPPPPPVEDHGDRAVQLLALLQRDGRLVDFLREDLAAYSDAQVGAAARDVHARSRVTLDRYIQLEPVSSEDEGEASLVSAASDPSTTRIVGNVPGQGSARGVVRHRGWRVVRMELPPLPPGHARQVVAPAEIEVG
jgi:Domain of unknown function (DUF2760)